jgi:predicted enzyme related to lactoylglutathione lyase
MDRLSDRLRGALRVTDASAVEDTGLALVVRVDSVERRYRDAIKAGATPVEGPRDEVGLGAWRRVARLVDAEGDRREVTVWSDRS